MLPKLSESGLSRRNQNIGEESTVSIVNQSRLSEQEWLKGVKQIKLCEEKLDEQLTLNKKLKNLYMALKQNLDRNSTANDEQQELSTLLKERKKNEAQYQHQCQILNALISDNSKLKEQVNTQRSKRAIYFNIYKNLQHQIQAWEIKYKNQLVETLKGEGIMTKMKQKFHKSQKKLKKQIQKLEKEMENSGKQQNDGLCESSEEREHIRMSKNKKTFKQFMFLDRKQSKIAVDMDENQGTIPIKIQISEEEQEYLLEQRKLTANGYLERIRTILQLNHLNQIKQHWYSIDNLTQQTFRSILQQQQKDKKLTQDTENMRMQINRLNQVNFERKLTIKQQKDKEQKIEEKRNQVKELEEKVSQIIGINVKQLQNDMMLHHCLRVKEEKTERKEGKRNLQKLLEQSKKNKIECSVLLSPKQMHKRLVESQASGKQPGMYNN